MSLHKRSHAEFGSIIQEKKYKTKKEIKKQGSMKMKNEVKFNPILITLPQILESEEKECKLPSFATFLGDHPYINSS